MSPRQQLLIWVFFAIIVGSAIALFPLTLAR